MSASKPSINVGEIEKHVNAILQDITLVNDVTGLTEIPDFLSAQRVAQVWVRFGFELDDFDLLL